MGHSDKYLQDTIEIALASAEAHSSPLVVYFLKMALYEHKEAVLVNGLKQTSHQPGLIPEPAEKSTNDLLMMRIQT